LQLEQTIRGYLSVSASLFAGRHFDGLWSVFAQDTWVLTNLVILGGLNGKTIMTVTLEVLGTVRLTNGSIKLIKGRKRLELLAYLLEARIAGKPEVSKIELIDALHPEIDEPRALNALRVEVHAIRKQISADVIVTTGTGYRLGDIQTDAEQFLQTRNTTLWQAAYLEGISFERNDDSGYQRLTDTLHECAQGLLESNPLESARVMRLLVSMEPFELEFLRTKLSAFRSANNHRALGRAYDKARARLCEVGEHLPKAWTEFLDVVKEVEPRAWTGLNRRKTLESKSQTNHP
jgi:hypothetical protein